MYLNSFENSFHYEFNVEEKDNEIYGDGQSYTAEFWQYDARLGRRWNVDPIIKAYESPYATFANNPVWYIDPFGLDTLLPNPSGKNFYLPDAVLDIRYFTSETAKGGISGREYLVKSESVKSFSMKDKTFNVICVRDCSGYPAAQR